LPFEYPVVHTRDLSVVAASWREVFFVLWRRGGGPDLVRAVLAQERAHVRRLRGRKMVVLTVIEPRIKMPDAATREAVDAARKDLDPHTKAEVVVLPVSGFVVATIRGIIAGIKLVRPPAYPTTVVDDLDAALDWTAPRLDPEEGEGRTAMRAALATAYATVHG
jgi:hypothetical protein